MQNGLVDLLINLSPERFRQLEKIAEKIAEAVRLVQESAQESFKASLNLESILGSDDPLTELDAFISSFRQYISAYPNGNTHKLKHKDYDAKRDKIKTLIYEFYDTHPDKQKTNLRVRDLLDVPGVVEIAGNEMSLARYLIVLRGEPGSRIKYHRSTQTYDILPLRDSVYEIADIILERQNAVIRADVEITLGTYGNRKVIGRHLMSWARERGLNSELVNFGRLYHSHVAYFRGKKRPELILEKVYAAVKGKRKVPHAHIKEATGLDKKTILAYTEYLRFRSEGEGHNRRYVRT